MTTAPEPVAWDSWPEAAHEVASLTVFTGLHWGLEPAPGGGWYVICKGTYEGSEPGPAAARIYFEKAA